MCYQPISYALSHNKVCLISPDKACLTRHVPYHPIRYAGYHPIRYAGYHPIRHALQGVWLIIQQGMPYRWNTDSVLQ